MNVYRVYHPASRVLWKDLSLRNYWLMRNGSIVTSLYTVPWTRGRIITLFMTEDGNVGWVINAFSNEKTFVEINT